MTKTISSLILVCLASTSFCQFKKIGISELTSVRNMMLKCIDDSMSVTTVCEQDLDNFEVEYYKALINEETGELRLIGRTCLSIENNSGMPGVSIYILNGSDHTLHTENLIQHTGDSKGENVGFFDITIKDRKNKSLIFYSKGFYIFEYAISKLGK